MTLVESPGHSSPTAVKDIAFIPDGKDKPMRKVERTPSKRGPKRSASDRLASRSSPAERPDAGKRSSSRRDADESPKQDRRGSLGERQRPGRRGSVGGGTTRRRGSVGGNDMRRGSLGTPVDCNTSEDATSAPRSTTMERIVARRGAGVRRRPDRRLSANGVSRPRECRSFEDQRVQRRSSLGSSSVGVNGVQECHSRSAVFLPFTGDLLLPSGEELGYGADNAEEKDDEKEKKSKSWKKKLVKLVTRPGSHEPTANKSLPEDDATPIGSKAA